jgi:hypothetical protein
MDAEASEETGETESGRQRTPLTMLIPTGVLVLLGVASGVAGMLPPVATALESAAARFTDAHAYAALVLHGVRVASPAPLYPQAPPDITAASVITALCTAAGAVLLALAALYRCRLPVLRWAGEPGGRLTDFFRSFQSGVVNDYVTWLVVGVAVLGGALALLTR